MLVAPVALFLPSSALSQQPTGQTTQQQVTELSPVTVTGTREKALLFETPASIGTIAGETIRQTAPMHPAQILGQIPGVAIAVTNGEGHTTAIRQPFTTSPVYLFLEDGIPIRATGFFNHNALYEVNIPMAGGIEVVRGPGSSLYGSDAIGGIVNVLSRSPAAETHFGFSGEGGAFGTRRVLASAGRALGAAGAVRVDLNFTHTDGWRDRTGYDRQSGNLRFDQRIGERGMLKAIVGVSKIDQETGANSALPLTDYLHHPTRNYLPIAFRKVSAARVSVEYEHQFGTGMLSLMPYFRDNSMDLNGTFNLSFDPRIERSQNVSYGMLAKWRKNLAPMRARLIGGVDFDYSPGSRKEDNLVVTRSGSGASTLYSAYSLGTRIYDYDVSFRSLSPYLHAEISPFAGLRVTTGLRFDQLDYEMSNNLPAGAVSASVHGATRFYGQLPEVDLSYSRLSPKLGATYAVRKNLHLFASHNCGFRAPSEGQLFRAGNDTTASNALTRSQLLLGLKPIKAHQTEFGVRGGAASWSFDLVAYQLIKRDDLVSQRDLATNVSTNVNAGRTEHRGIEAGVGTTWTKQWRFDLAFSYARHRYVEWRTATANFDGNNMEAAPRIIANSRLTWKPKPALMLQAELVRLGSYWLEAGNSATFGRYPGHTLVNLRASYALSKHLSVVGRVINVMDRRFAESASVSSNTPVFSPGLPRALYCGLDARW